MENVIYEIRTKRGNYLSEWTTLDESGEDL